MTATGGVLTVDVGNTHLRATSWPPGDPPSRGPDSPAEVWTHSLDGEVWRTALAGVVPGHTAVYLGAVGRRAEEVHEVLGRAHDTVVAFLRGDRFPLATAVQQPETVGVDRLAGALGAFHQTRGDAIVVDVGTAITVDWIDAGGTFRGGAIVPGRRLALRALAEGTLRLPELSLWDDERPRSLPGCSTHQAIEHGVDVGWVGLVEALIEDLGRSARGAAPCWLTGGDAAWLQARSRRTYRRDPHLVARGLREAGRRVQELRS